MYNIRDLSYIVHADIERRITTDHSNLDQLILTIFGLIWNKLTCYSTDCFHKNRIMMKNISFIMFQTDTILVFLRNELIDFKCESLSLFLEINSNQRYQTSLVKMYIVSISYA